MTVTTVDLSVSGSGSSVVDPRAWDEKTGQLRRRGKVLTYDTFATGLDGWSPNHFHYDNSSTLLGRTRRHPMQGPFAMLVAPSELPYSQAQNYHGASAYKRLGWAGPVGVQTMSGWLAIRAGSGTDLLTQRKYPIEQMWVGMDSQIPDGTSRAFGVVYLRDNLDGTMSLWLKGGKRGTGANAETRPDVEIPGTRMWFTGFNENKANKFYFMLMVNPGAMITGGDYYLELQWNGRVFDLRGLTGIPYDLLLNNGTHDMFTAGDNYGVGISRSKINQDQNVAHLMASNVLITINDKVAA